MLFKRRRPASLAARIREFFWPRKGMRRPFRYYRLRVLRLGASPHAIAAGVAAGVVSSWTPFLGFHVVIALALAFVIGGNLVAAALTTAVANPLTLPFICATTLEIGNLMLGRPAAEIPSLDIIHMFEHLQFAPLWAPVLKPMLIGAVPPALLTAALMYGLTFASVRAFRERRRLRLVERASARMLAAPPEPRHV